MHIACAVEQHVDSAQLLADGIDGASLGHIQKQNLNTGDILQGFDMQVGGDDLRARIGDRVAIARERLADAEAAIVDTGRKAVRVTDDYVHENPWQSVGVAAGVAFLLGLLVSRR